jgi:hypothetical protein
VPRPLEPDERDVLLKVLDQGFPDAQKLRAQVPSVTVVGGTPPTWLDLQVDPDAEPAECRDGPVPGSAWVYDAGGAPIGTILVWIKNGCLSALEYAWVTDAAPTSFPRAEAVISTPR